MVMEEMKIANLSDDELRMFSQDYLKLQDHEFILKYNVSKAEIEQELDSDENLADKFNAILDKSFIRKMQRDCFVGISQLVKSIADSDDFNEKRVAQQSLQTLMSLQKGLGAVKSEKSDLASVLEELS